VKPVSSSRSPKVRPVRATPSGSRAVRPRHAPSRALSARCSATRSFRTSTALPGNRIPPSSFLARRRSWVQCCTLRRFVPADRWSKHYCRPGPTCRFDAPRPTRFILFGLTDRLRWRVNFKGRSAEDLVFGVALDFWALTPICDPHPPALYGRRTDPALGFASCRVVGHASVQPIGLDPDSARGPPGSHGPRFIAEPRNPYPLMGLKTTARLLPSAY
jgi:hypothetical protein